MSSNSKLSTKSFSVSKYGYEEAFKLATDFRCSMIDGLIKKGAFYGEGHGI